MKRYTALISIILYTFLLSACGSYTEHSSKDKTESKTSKSEQQDSLQTQELESYEIIQQDKVERLNEQRRLKKAPSPNSQQSIPLSIEEDDMPRLD